MERKAFIVPHGKNPKISIRVIPGHFATSNAHTNHFLDVSYLKSGALAAREVARELALPYSGTVVETVVCMENTEVIGAYLAEELMKNGMTAVDGGEVYVVSPAASVNRKWIFQDNTADLISDRKVILLVASISSGRTAESALECLAYYGGDVAGISVLFLASPERLGKEVHALFRAEDILGYSLTGINGCAMCSSGRKLDAMINSEGYVKF